MSGCGTPCPHQKARNSFREQDCCHFPCLEQCLRCYGGLGRTQRPGTEHLGVEKPSGSGSHRIKMTDGQIAAKVRQHFAE